MTGRGDLHSTVDPSDIRGLVTTGHRSVRERPHSTLVRSWREPRARRLVEDSPRTVAGPTRHLQAPRVLIQEAVEGTGASTRRAVAQRKAINSRAIAVITLLCCLPRALSRR